PGGERIGGSRRHERLRHKVDLAGWVFGQRIEEKVRGAKEWWLAIELEIVLSLEDVIKDTEAAADTHLAVAFRVPGEAQAGRPIVAVRIIGPARRSGVSREQQARRRIGKDAGLLAQHRREGAPLQIQLGRAVFIADPECQPEIAADLPFVLEEPSDI